MSDRCSASAGHQAERSDVGVARRCRTMPVSGSNEPPCQLAPPVDVRQHQRRQRPVPLAHHRRREDRTDLVPRRPSSPLPPCSSGVKSIRSSSEALRSNAGGLVGNGCVGEYHSPGTSTARPAAPRSARPARRCAIEDIEQPCFVGCATALIAPAVDRDVGEDRRARNVLVPDAVMDELVVPLALAGLQVDGDQALGEEIRRRDDGRRSSRRSASRPGGRRCPSSSSTVICAQTPVLPVYTTNRSPRCRCRTRPAAEWCGRSTAAFRSARRSRDVALPLRLLFGALPA